MSSDVEWQEWSFEQVCEKLKEHQLPDVVVEKFRSKKITGKQLKFLMEDHMLSEMGIETKDEHFAIQRFLEKIGCLVHKKVMNDPIHGHVEFHPVCIAIIDTPQFQRLRNLKQLGSVEFVYPAASNNRFEHSLGTCHLAGQFVRSLRENQKVLDITEKDILCVEIAGLCHDLGHGPFSHLFDRGVIPVLRPDRGTWTHEEASADLLDYLIEKNDLMKDDGILTQYGLRKEDIDFIKNLIKGSEPSDSENDGRGKSKAFLYEIVANKRNGVDVDKWDYFARDCHRLGIKNNFDHTRFIKFARVCVKANKPRKEKEGSGAKEGAEAKEGEEAEESERKIICIRKKEIGNLANMFFTRYTLHKFAYQHKVSCGIDLMLIDALTKSNELITIPGKNGKRCKISECIDDMEAYSNLTDNIIFMIRDFDELEEKEKAEKKINEMKEAKEIIERQKKEAEKKINEMKEAKEIIERIFRRELYRCVGESRPLTKEDFGKIDKKEQIKEELMGLLKGLAIEKGDFQIQIAALDFGMKTKNPLNHVFIYSKDKPDEAVCYSDLPRDSSILDPLSVTEKLIRVYCCVTDSRKQEEISKAFQNWCAAKNFQSLTQ